MIDLRLGDCLEIMPTLEAKSLDAVFTDIPYNISQKSNGLKGKELDFGKWDLLTDEQLTVFLWFTKRIARNCAIICCSAEQVSTICKSFKQSDWLVRQLTWYKPNGFSMNGDKMYLWSTENAVFAKRRGTPFYADSKRNLFEYPTVNGKEHPTQKPVELLIEWLDDTTKQGDTILDPFAGSGTLGVACVKTNRNAVLIEKEPAYFEIAQRRIKEAQAQIALPLN